VWRDIELAGDVGGLFIRGVGALSEADIGPESREVLFSKRLAASKLIGGVSRLYRDRSDLLILVQILAVSAMTAAPEVAVV
jgi:hypothetical protein